MTRLLIAVCAASFGAAACGAPARPTVTGAELYAQVHALQESGQATIGTTAVHKGQVLAAGEQTFVVEQVIDNCHGGDPTTDADCALALLLDQRFTVLDHAPEGRGVTHDHEDQTKSIASSVVIVSVAVAAVGGLVYGVATCEFAGCKYVFGVPLVFIGAGSLFLLGRD